MTNGEMAGDKCYCGHFPILLRKYLRGQRIDTCEWFRCVQLLMDGRIPDTEMEPLRGLLMVLLSSLTYEELATSRLEKARVPLQNFITQNLLTADKQSIEQIQACIVEKDWLGLSQMIDNYFAACTVAQLRGVVKNFCQLKLASIVQVIMTSDGGGRGFMSEVDGIVEAAHLDFARLIRSYFPRHKSAKTITRSCTKNNCDHVTILETVLAEHWYEIKNKPLSAEERAKYEKSPTIENNKNNVANVSHPPLNRSKEPEPGRFQRIWNSVKSFTSKLWPLSNPSKESNSASEFFEGLLQCLCKSLNVQTLQSQKTFTQLVNILRLPMKRYVLEDLKESLDLAEDTFIVDDDTIKKRSEQLVNSLDISFIRNWRPAKHIDVEATMKNLLLKYITIFLKLTANSTDNGLYEIRVVETLGSLINDVSILWAFSYETRLSEFLHNNVVFQLSDLSQSSAIQTVVLKLQDLEEIVLRSSAVVRACPYDELCRNVLLGSEQTSLIVYNQDYSQMEAGNAKRECSDLEVNAAKKIKKMD